jgi:outer membrane protein assembly factor BamB
LRGGAGDADPGDPHDGGERNPGLVGRLIFLEDNELYAIDAETGELSFVPNTNWREQIDRFRYPAVTDFFTSKVEHSGSEFIGFGQEVERSYVFSQDYNGNVLWQFDLQGEILGGTLS